MADANAVKSSLRPRRRAAIACDNCRQRKRRCDGQKPICGLCQTTSKICVFDGPRDAVDIARVPREILQRLNELEARAGQSQSIQQPSHWPSEGNTVQQFSPLSEISFPLQTHGSGDIIEPIEPVDPIESSQHHEERSVAPDEDNEEPLTIPVGHLTTTSTLFQLDTMKKLVGHYPDNVFLQIESSRAFDVPTQNQGPHLEHLDCDAEVVEILVRRFFAEFHSHFPILEERVYPPSSAFFVQASTEPNAGTALRLIIIASGKMATDKKPISMNEFSYVNGFDYFAPAHNILVRNWALSFTWDLDLPAALILAAIYLYHLGRPLHAWQLIHMASVKLQMMCQRLASRTLAEQERESLIRMCWACFILECDSFAEYHLPRSGIEVIIEQMPFPSLDSQYNRNRVFFLAMCSMRRLLNRIHREVYADGRSFELSTHEVASPISTLSTPYTLENICLELIRQLESWFESLPSLIKPENLSDWNGDMQEKWILMRYWSARYIITRPYLILVASLDTGDNPPLYAVEMSAVCIASCREYSEGIVQILDSRSPYAWMLILATLACAFSLAIAAQSPFLKHLVPDADEILGRLILALRSWVCPGSTAESVQWMVSTIKQKLKLSNVVVVQGSSF